jgi:hypothetical protein
MATVIAQTGILFGAGYMVCSGINYFLQLGMITGNIPVQESGRGKKPYSSFSGSQVYWVPWVIFLITGSWKK